MQAVTVKNSALLVRADYPAPTLTAGEALLRVRLAGICGTDLEIVRGYADFQGVLGHEFVADVAAVADENDSEWVGRRVVGTINVGCGSCTECQTYGPEHCPTRTVPGIRGRDGAFADYLRLPVRNLLPVPDRLTDEQAVFCEPLAAALRIRQQLRLDPTHRVAVIGAGRLGLLIGQVLALDGSRVQVLVRREASLEKARRLRLEGAIAAEQPSDAYDVVVDSSGHPSGFAAAVRLVRPRGRIVMKSTYAAPATADLTKVVVSELTLVGSRCGPFEPALRLLASGAVAVQPLIDGRYPLADAQAAFEHAARRGVLKVLLRP